MEPRSVAVRSTKSAPASTGRPTSRTAETARSRSRRCGAAASASASRRRSPATRRATHPFPGWHSPEQAWAMTQAQLAWYRAMEERGELVQITDAGGARSPSRRGGADGADDAPIGYVLSLEGADSLVTLGASRARVCAGAAGGRPRALRAGRLRAGHQRAGRPRRARPRAGARDGAARDDPRRHASLRRELSRRARPLPRPRLGQPLELPRARRPQPAVHRRPDPRAHRARRRHRRGVRCVDDRARLGARRIDARDAPA